MRCTRSEKPRSALDILDEIHRFLQADACGQAIEFNGLKLVTSVESINNLGGETLVRAKFDAGISQEEVELCFDPSQPPGPLPKIVDSARVQYTKRYSGHCGHYDKKGTGIHDSVHTGLPIYGRPVNR